MAVLQFDEAVDVVLRLASNCKKPEMELLALLQSRGRVLAEEVCSDRDQPAFARSTRDGYAVQAMSFSAGARFRLVGSIRAGEKWRGHPLHLDEAIQIMTGAPLPEGADAVAMVEFVERSDGGVATVPDRTLASGENVVPRGSEAKAGQVVIESGTWMSAAEIALAAACGRADVRVFRKPKVSIIATGDELVELAQGPLEDQQIWNSNSYALAAMVSEAGGVAERLAVARDTCDDVRARVAEGRRSDLLVLSGGISMGEYDLVEEVLEEAGAEFFFTGVKMQPGKPVVFGRLPERGGQRQSLFFGLPGNPVSAHLTFHCFVEPILRALAGGAVEGPRFAQATLAEDVAGKLGLMRLLPARVSRNRARPEVRLVAWQGSGDVAANARANCYAVLPPEQERFAAGEVISVLLR